MYFLKVLKTYGAPTRDLPQFYCSAIRSTLKYGDVLCHERLKNYQSENIKRIHKKRVFRIILLDVDYIEALNQLNIKTLRERRERHCIDLIVSMYV